MTTYILILIFAGYQQGGATSAEFTTMDACRNAMSMVEAKVEGLTRTVYAVCVPKGLTL